VTPESKAYCEKMTTRIAELEADVAALKVDAERPNLESRDFYEVMQAYRTCPVDAAIPFEAVKEWLRNPTYIWEEYIAQEKATSPGDSFL